jgi:hypothetical protein
MLTSGLSFRSKPMSTIQHTAPDGIVTSTSQQFHRLNFVLSAPRGGALSFCRRMNQLGEVGLPHTHLPIRHNSDYLGKVGSHLELFSLDDGLIRALSGIIYGGFQTYQLEAAYNDLSTMYSRQTFGHTYERLLMNTRHNIYDPSFSLSLFPDAISELEYMYPESQYIYIFRDPYFYAPSVLTSIHGLDSLLIWWSIARESQPTITLDPLNMWCMINEALLASKSKHLAARSVRVLRHPESDSRYSFQRIDQMMRSEYAAYTPPARHSAPSRSISSAFRNRLSMSARLGRLIDTDPSNVVSPIQDKTSSWLDITLGGDPSANLPYYSNPGKLIPEYWMKLIDDTDLIERCDNLCSILGFTLLSSRLQKYHYDLIRPA